MQSKYFIVVLLLLLSLSLVMAAPENDIDEDGVLNERDVCPDTSKEQVVVDPAANLIYAGCSCEQIKQLIDVANPCISFFCYGEVLDIHEKTYRGPLVDCPEDYCEGVTFYDYAADGYDTCRGEQLITYTCGPLITERSPDCGYEPSDTPIPVLEGKVQKYTLTEATFSHTLPEPVVQGDDQSITALFELDTTSYKNIDVELYLDGQLIPADEKYCGEDVALFCTAFWNLDSSTAGKQEYILHIDYDAGTPITEDIPFSFTVKQPPFNPEPATSMILRVDGDDQEQHLLDVIYAELEQRELYTTKETFLDMVKKTEDYLTIEKNLSYHSITNTTTYTVSVTPEEGLIADVTIIEYIPKEVVASAQDIIFNSGHNITILRDDPLIMWHFAAVDERVDISYEVAGEQKITGNTVAVADSLENETSVWFIVLPMLLIPLLVILLIVIPRMKHHED